MRTYIRDYKWGKIILLKYDFISDLVNFYGEWADLEVSLFASILELGDDVIEVGCNIGMHTIPLCQFVGNTGRVIGFEPQRVMYQALCGSIAINNLTNAYLYNYAVGEMDGEIYVPSLDYDEKSNYGGLALGDYTYGEKIDLKPLDSLEIVNNLSKLKLIKVDVEGMESNVIQGARNLISKFRPFLFVENNQEDKGNSLIQLIHDLGYICYWFCVRGYNTENYNSMTLDILDGKGDWNMLCIPNEHKKHPNFLQKVNSFNESIAGKVYWTQAVDPSWYKSSLPTNSPSLVENVSVENDLIGEDFDVSVEFYEQAIASHPHIKSNYWHLGLAQLLQGEEEEAQTTWFSAIADETPEQLDVALSELTQILETEAQNREAIGDNNSVWLIRQHIRENNPEDLNNLLKLILASIEIEEFNPDGDRNLQQATELLSCEPLIEFELTPPTLLSRVLKQLRQLGLDSSSILNETGLNTIEESIDFDLEEFASACITYYQTLQDRDPDRALYPFLLGTIYTEMERAKDAIAACERALTLNPSYAEAYFGLGNLELNRGNDEGAIAQYQQAIKAQTNFAKPYVNLAFVLEKRSQLDPAIVYLRQAIQIDPNFVEAHRNLGILLRKLGRIEEAIAAYQKALSIKPNDFMANVNLGDVLVAIGKQNEAIPHYQAAIAVQPKNSNVYYQLGNIWFRQNQLDQAIACYQTVIQIDPEFIDAYKNLILVLIRKTDLGEPFYGLWRQITEEYANLSDRLYSQSESQTADQTWATPTSMAIRSHLMSGNHQVALEKFQTLEPQIYLNPQDLTLTDIKTLYGELLFFVLFLRDDRAANTKLFRQIGKLYLNQILKPTQDASLLLLSSNRLPKSKKREKLKIAILSKSFRRHATAWCCFNFIEELSKLTTELYLYDTGKFRDDDMTAKFEHLATKYYRTPTTVTEEIGKLVTAEILKDEVDIVLELDSMMNVASAEILSYHPAPICVSWPGLEAPFLSERNYFLCDRHLVPEECDRLYLEQIVRMPDSYLAVTDLKHDPIDRESARAALGITPTQIVYLSITAGHKFNRAVASAAVQILRQVPDSVLLCKGKGDPDLIQEIYQQECDLLGVSSERIKFLPPRTSTEETHRSTYLLADVLLDSHPYNSCTHSLEALWLNIPIVTIVGDQFFARFGYSFLQTLNIQAGIARNWEEYVNWAVKLGTDWELRDSIRQQIAQSKQPETLSPLWNPQKFAIDMYDMFEELLSKIQ